VTRPAPRPLLLGQLPPRVALIVTLSLLLGACGTQPSASPTRASAGPSAPGSPTPSAGGGPIGPVQPAPGSKSTVYAPNPGAIVVAIDPGHGGCLDWGVPDPRQRGVGYSEKTMTLAIGLALRRLLEAQGVAVVMTRDTDTALAGDDYPQLGCRGAKWRDVNGDGESGFDPGGEVRTRDELQARLDLANVTRADVLVSIHINSITQNGVVFSIAATETFYTDETPWGVDVTARLAQAIQDGVVRSMGEAAPYDRQDRGIQAQNLYIVAPPLLKTTPERPDPRKQPTRGALMPSVLTEVGSITMRQEQSLLASATGQQAAADGIFSALATYFSERPLAVGYSLPELDDGPGTAPQPRTGNGPPYWPPSAPGDHLVVRLTNTGSRPWPAGMQLLGAWQATDEPYLGVPPDHLAPIVPDALPALAPGAAVDVRLALPSGGSGGRRVAWITVADADGPLTELGSPPLQVASGS
jgi:N-acetylmuramoyl-L-alanine amidase